MTLLKRMGLGWVRQEPLPSALDLADDGEVIRIELRRSPQARRMLLRIDLVRGVPVLTMPARTRLATAERFATAHLGWLRARLARLPAGVPLVCGALVPLRGVEHRIVQGPPRGAPVTVRAVGDGTPELVVCGAAEGIARRIETFLRAEARRDLQRACAHYAARHGVTIGRITVKDTRSRWGSCSARGDLAFSWRLVMAPPPVLDYLAAHEVTHRHEMNHSARYWRLLRSVCPQTDESEAWLKRHGAGLHRYGRA